MPKPSQTNLLTVLDLFEHFKKLKKDSLKLKKKFKATKRGYFTPTEEEEVKHIFAAYWNARSALFEIIFEVQNDLDEIDDLELYDKTFLTGFTAASILVEAAQFLYETFDDSPVVRAKLNEEDLSLGIPKYSYSSILQSLYDSEHLIDLYYNRRYYETHYADFEQYAAKDKDLKKLISILNKLQGSIKNDLFSYFKNMFYLGWRGFLHELDDLAVDHGMYSLQKWVSKLLSSVSVYPLHTPKIAKKVRKKISKKLRPGDVLLSRKEYEVTNYFLPGYWPHACLYLGDGKVLEALKDGVKVRNMNSIFASDSLVVLRSQLDEDQIKKAMQRGLKHEGKPYDFDFDFKESHRLVCTEVIYRSFEGLGGIRFDLSSRAGRKNLSTDDIIEKALQHQDFDCVLVYCPEKAKKILYGKKACRFIEENV